MNLIRINEAIEGAIRLTGTASTTIKADKVIRLAKTWPLLTLDLAGFEPVDPVIDIDGLPMAPFGAFRYVITGKGHTVVGVAERDPDTARLQFMSVYLGGDPRRRFVLHVGVEADPAHPGQLALAVNVFDPRLGRQLRAGEGLSDADRHERAIEASRLVTALCTEYCAAHNFVAVVRPPSRGRSVEWVQAREHLTLIHRRHEANRKGVARGATVDSPGNLKRCAHSRRAHERVLRSERYRRQADGTPRVLKIRAIWVGPDEWRDQAGQTYRIVRPKTA